MNRFRLPEPGSMAAIAITLTLAIKDTHAEVTDFDPSRLVAIYHVEGLYDMIGLGSWNGAPVSETNQPSPFQRRLAADVSFYRDESDPLVLWIAVTGIITTQAANWWGSPVDDVSLTGFGLGLASRAGESIQALGYSGDFALATQYVLSSAGAQSVVVTPGYGLFVSGSSTWVRCVSGANYAMSSFGWVSGVTRLNGGAVFRLSLDQDVDEIDWPTASLTARYGVDHQFVAADLLWSDSCPGDVDGNGQVQAEDLAYVLFAWGMTGGKAGGADINGDATVDANDLSLVLGSWGPCPG